MVSKERKRKENKRLKRYITLNSLSSDEKEKLREKHNLYKRIRYKYLSDEKKKIIQLNSRTNIKKKRKILTEHDKFAVKQIRKEKEKTYSELKKKTVQIQNKNVQRIKRLKDKNIKRVEKLNDINKQKVIEKNYLIKNNNKENQFYFEKQISNQCGLHALNNLLQFKCFSFEELKSIAKQLDINERLLYDSNHYNSSNYGDFTLQTLMAALQYRNYKIQSITNIENLLNSNQLHSLIITKDNHHFALRRFKVNGPWWNFNSLHQQPKIDNNVLAELLSIDKFRRDFHILEVFIESDNNKINNTNNNTSIS